jgi:hypothetical protein
MGYSEKVQARVCYLPQPTLHQDPSGAMDQQKGSANCQYHAATGLAGHYGTLSEVSRQTLDLIERLD